jgi:hypothetical protein
MEQVDCAELNSIFSTKKNTHTVHNVPRRTFGINFVLWKVTAFFLSILILDEPSKTEKKQGQNKRFYLHR